MRIEKETEVTIKVKIGYVWPDDFKDEFGKTYVSEDEFREDEELIGDPETARDIILDGGESISDLLFGAEITVRDLGITQE